MKKSEPVKARRWAVVDCAAPFTPIDRIRWASRYNASPELYATRAEARAAIAEHNAKAEAWGWRQRVARVLVTIAEEPAKAKIRGTR